ncbi:SDR family NAD(P)-dependent oxidoreductase [Streptomyces sp. NPDC048277]|uniref:SDR family NAD(P)-dependent oxidoreductase n=1 Tax=Streptomyces sp. NPDC048277 TaxID=3155027 RepID=UPI0033F22E08
MLAAKEAAEAVWDLNSEGAGKTAAEIQAAGGTAIPVAGDAADAAGAPPLRPGPVRSSDRPVTILVNNAGITAYEPFTGIGTGIGEASWDRIIGINLEVPYLVTQALGPDRLAAGWSRIINIASSSAQTGAPAMAHYAASRGGVIGLTRALAVG